MFLLIFLQKCIRSFNQNRDGSVGCVARGGGGSHTPFLQNYYKKCTDLACIHKQNLWGGESPMSATKSRLAIAFKHQILPIFKNNLFIFCFFLNALEIFGVFYKKMQRINTLPRSNFYQFPEKLTTFF